MDLKCRRHHNIVSPGAKAATTATQSNETGQGEQTEINL
jgi:hypothetical protein